VWIICFDSKIKFTLNVGLHQLRLYLYLLRPYLSPITKPEVVGYLALHFGTSSVTHELLY
jgi:hypothetical protein